MFFLFQSNEACLCLLLLKTGNSSVDSRFFEDECLNIYGFLCWYNKQKSRVRWYFKKKKLR